MKAKTNWCKTCKSCKTPRLSSGHVTKSKMHPKYHKFFSENTVTVLRQKARSAGATKWYSLRKSNLVSAIVIHGSAVTVTSLFRGMMNRKRALVLDSKKKDGSKCPISLTPISDLSSNDVFIHDGVVFSRDAILDYVEASVDFLNPITRTSFQFHDIKRLGCEGALDKYRNRVSLRTKKVHSIRQFAFLEIELDNIFTSLMQQYYFKETPFYDHSLVAFRRTWKEMRATDHSRTVCVLKCLEQSADRFQGRPHLWGRSFVARYLEKT